MNGRVRNVLRRCFDRFFFFVNGRALRLGGYTFMNGRNPDRAAHAPFRDFMNGRMGAFRHKGNVKADYMKKAATTALIRLFNTLPVSCVSS